MNTHLHTWILLVESGVMCGLTCVAQTCVEIIQQVIQIIIDSIIIERVNENTFVGVILDRKFCWKLHT